MKNVIGCQLPYGPSAVTIDGEPAPFEESLKLWNHSPTGCAWGYGGSGPAQTALAVLLAVVGPELAVKHHQRFKDVFVVWLPQMDCRFEVDVKAWVESQEGES